MSKHISNVRLGDIGRKLAVIGDKLRRYSVMLFLIFVACIYGVVIWRINTLLTAQPSQEAISSQVKANSIPRVDPAVVKQLHDLRDNSVNVQALFDQGRNNPFQ